MASSWITSRVSRSLCRNVAQQFRTVTIRSSQAKLHESLSLDSTQKFRDAKPEKRRLPLDANRPQHLSAATAKLTQLSQLRDYDAAMAAYREIQDPDDTLKIAALGLCVKALWWPQACEIWTSISQKSTIGYSTMIELCARLNRSSDAELLFQEMSSHQVEPSCITYTSMIKAFSNCGESAKALEMFNAMQPSLVNASVGAHQIAYQVVMAAFSREGDYATTRELFIRMTQSGVAPDRGHYHSLMAACAGRGDAATAQLIFESMPAAGLQPDVQSYTVLISCSRFDLPRCLAIVEEMAAARIEPTARAFGELLEAHVLAKDGAGAKALIGRAHSLDVRSRKIKGLLRQVEMM